MAESINEELEHQYQCSHWSVRGSPDHVIQQHISTCKAESEKAVSMTPGERDIVYGPGDKQRLDVFGADSAPPDAPIFVFIHGGYWQEMSREYYWLVAPPLVKAGAVVVCVGYDLAPSITLKEIVDEVRAAICHVLQMARRRGSRGVYISGHSAGGHLASMMLATDWDGLYKEDNKLIKGAVIISGVFDLRPLVHTTINEPLHLTEESAWELSPANHMVMISSQASHVTVLVCLGQHESPALHEQARNFTKDLKNIGIKVDYCELPDKDHFNLVEQLVDPKYQLTKEIIHLMGVEKE